MPIGKNMKLVLNGDDCKSSSSCLNHHKFHVKAGSSLPSPTTCVLKCVTSGKVRSSASNVYEVSTSRCLRTRQTIPQRRSQTKRQAQRSMVKCALREKGDLWLAPAAVRAHPGLARPFYPHT